MAARRRLLPSARELFPMLRARLLASRPLLEPAKKVTHRPQRGVVHPRLGYNVQVAPAKYGAPTFRNVIENGEHV
ncbi:hypothetical protein [Glaciibacter superstes]|uniref:hypothetical protein n=1 Tax=Glaciibacter superstes TaxID=501023 RepID=UPI0003B5F581|nr:hypothetical protein [Glaciibacter superstes]